MICRACGYEDGIRDPNTENDNTPFYHIHMGHHVNLYIVKDKTNILPIDLFLCPACGTIRAEVE